MRNGMRIVSRAALAAVLSTVALGASCERKTEKNIEFIYLVTETSELVIAPVYSFDSGEQVTCAGAQSWLLRMNTSDGGPTWDYTLLFNANHSALYGCTGPDAIDADGRCADTNLGFNVPPPRRVMLEALSVAPGEYAAATSGIDVLCRGVADGDVLATDVVTENFPVSTEPVPSPTSALASRHTVVLRMLRVGESNVLPLGASTPIVPPDVRYGAAAGFSNARDGVGMDPADAGAGRIVLAGGEHTTLSTMNAEVWELDPLTLTFSHTTNLGVGRAGLTANTFDGGDRTGIVFAGGSASSGTPQSRAVDVYWSDSTIESVPLGLATARAFHSSTYLPRNTNGHVIAVIGGGNYNPDTDGFGGSEVNSFEFFLPPNAVANAPCNTPQAAWRFCVPGSGNTLTNARMRAGAPGYKAIDGTTLAWVAGGQASTTGLTSGQTFTGGGTGTLSAGAALNASAVAPVTVVIGSSGNSSLTGRPLFIGGYANGGTAYGAQTLAAYLDGAGAAVGITDALQHARGDATGTVLRDKSVLIAGGRNDTTNGVQPFELFVPASGTGGAVGTFELIPDALGSAGCDLDSDDGCAKLLFPRFGHTATRLDATRTWLDGSVLIAGGGGGTTAPELFVPALRCDATTHLAPVTALGDPAEPLSNDQLPPLCDRDRTGGAVTNPKPAAE